MANCLNMTKMSPTSPQQVVVMEFGKRHNRLSDTNWLQTCYRKLV